VAVSIDTLKYDLTRLINTGVLPNLKTAYFVVDDSRFATRDLRWCAHADAQSSIAVSFKHVVDAKGHGPARDPRWFAPTDIELNPGKIPARNRAYRQVYSWPDPLGQATAQRRGRGSSTTREQQLLPCDHLQKMQGARELRYWLYGPEDSYMLEAFGSDYRPVGMLAWPLVKWGEHGTERLEKIFSWNGNEDDWQDTDHEDDDSDEECKVSVDSDAWSE